MDVRANRFLKSFSPAGLEQLVSQVTYHEFLTDDYLFHEGDEADGVHLLLEGRVEIVKTAGEHEFHVLALLEAGDFLGEIAVLDGHGRSTGARAIEAVTTAKIPSAALIEVLLAEPVAMTLELFQHVLELLRRTNDLYVREVVRKEKLSLIGGMADSLMHELQSPVEVILAASDILRTNHSDKATVECCEKMRAQCDRLVSIATELLQFANGETILHLSRTDTGALLRQFESFNEDLFRTSGIEFDIEAEPAEIEVDIMRLLEVLQNLVENSMHALAAKTNGRIDIRAWVRDSILYLSVRDNGPGLPAEIQDKIFEPFVDQGKDGAKGLGMAIAHRVVTAHRGKMTFETMAGQGTQFLMKIPQDASSGSVQ